MPRGRARRCISSIWTVAARAAVAQSPARSGRGPRARARMAARLLEASAAAVVGGRRDLSRHRHRARGLSARAALGRRLHVCGVAARPRHRRRLPGADRGRGAGRHSLLQFLGAEIRARPDAASVLGADRPVSLSRASRASACVDWLLAGAALALCFWSKYAAFALAGSIALFMLFDPAARRTLAHARAVADGARVPRGDRAQSEMAGRDRLHAAALCRCARQDRDALVSRGHLSAAMDREPALLPRARDRPDGARAAGGARTPPRTDDERRFARRYVTMLALGPFLVTTAIALVAGRLPVAMWGYPLWSFAPLAALLWLGPVSEPVRLRRFAAGFLAVFVAMPLAYAVVEGLEPAMRDRPKATQFPGRALAEKVTQTLAREIRDAAPLCGRRRVRHQQHRGLFARPAARDRACRSRRSARGSIATRLRAAAP